VEKRGELLDGERLVLQVGAVGLARALAALPEGLRQVIELAVYQELPYAEVAEILDIPVGTVKSRMFNALAKLRALLK